VPTNSTRRADRIDAWNDAARAGHCFLPKRLAGKDARYRWIDSIVKSDLQSTTRLVAHTLALHGQANGERIFPSIRRLASGSSLSERAVCAHIDQLVRRGFLLREARGGDTAGAKGFKYLLTIPQVLTDDQHKGAANRSRRSHAVLTEDQHRESVLTDDQHCADPGASSVDANSSSVLTVRQPIQVLIHKSINPELVRAPARATEGARAQEIDGAQRRSA
jgi:hypothetical protein